MITPRLTNTASPLRQRTLQPLSRAMICEFMDNKNGGKPFKGVAEEPNKRRE